MPLEHCSLAERVALTAAPLEANKTNISKRDVTAPANVHLFGRGCDKEKSELRLR